MFCNSPKPAPTRQCGVQDGARKKSRRASERKGLGPFAALRSSHLQPVTAQQSLTYASILTIGFIKMENSSKGPPAANLPTLPSAYLSSIRIDQTGFAAGKKRNSFLLKAEIFME